MNRVRPRQRRVRAIWLSAVAIALCGATVQLAQASDDRVPAAMVKAAFLYNFAKLAEWPVNSLAPDGSLAVCTNDTAVADSLAQLLKARDAHDHAIDVRRVRIDSAEIRSCHLLYVCDLNQARLAQLVETVNGASVLTVSDFERFAALGGVVQFVEDGGRLRFAINLDSMRRHRLQLSSRLLALASIVKDEAGVH